MYRKCLADIEKCLIESKKSENTKKLYLHIYKNFFKHFGNYADSLTEKDIEEYFAKKRFNSRNRNLAISALKFLFKIPNKILSFLNKKENAFLKNQEFILQFSPKKAEAAFQKALANAKIDKKIKLKNLKISSIVHLLERGTSYESIKLLHGLPNNSIIKQCEFLASGKNLNILNPIDWIYL